MMFTTIREQWEIFNLNGEQVFEKDIKLIEKDNYSAWTEWSWEGVSEKAAVVLDRAITKLINLLFEELIAEKESLSRL